MRKDNRHISVLIILWLALVFLCGPADSAPNDFYFFRPANSEMNTPTSAELLKLAKETLNRDAIYGRVTDAQTKQPIPGAVIELKNANFGLGYYRVAANKNGTYHIPDFIRHVRYKIEVSAPEYVNAFHVYEIRPGRYDFELTKESVISGIVSNSANKPLADVEVKLESVYRRYDRSDANEEDVRHRPIFLTTGRDGKYRFGKLPEGEYLVTFQKTGWITETARVRAVSTSLTDLPMQMFLNTSVSGRILIQDLDIGAANIDVVIEGRSRAAAASNTDGSYQLEGIKPGRHQITLNHRGFVARAPEPIDIVEGQSRNNVNFTVVQKNPEVEVYSDRYTFVIGQQAAFSLKAFRLEKVHVRLYRLPVSVAMKGRMASDQIRPDADGLKLIRQWEEGVRDFNPYEWQHQQIDIAEPLPAGGYCIEVEGAGNLISRKLFSVTSIGVVVKRSPHQVLAYVTDLAANKPLAGAPVILFDQASAPSPAPARPPGEEESDGETEDIWPDSSRRMNENSGAFYSPPVRLDDLPVTIVAKAETGPDGTVQLPVSEDKALSLMAVASDGSYAVCATGAPAQFAREKDKTFIYTDRPVYRAGDKVFYKIIAKSMTAKPEPLANQNLFYVIRHQETDSVVDSGSFSLDEWGTHQSQWTLAEDTRLGAYQIRVGPSQDNLYSEGTFYVDQYRKPEFKIDLTAAKEYFINRDAVEFKVEAKYLFGAPLKNAVIHYRFYESKLRDSEARYWWEDDEEPSRSFSKVKLEGDKTLDENGIALLKLAAGDLPYDREITLEVTVTDRSNVSVTASETVRVGRGEYYVKIQPAQNFFAEDDKKAVTIKTLSHTGKPVAASLDVKVYRYIWRAWQRLYMHEAKPIFTRTVKTGASGAATIELPDKFDYYGEYDIVVEGKDVKGNLINASRVVWIYSRHASRVDSRLKNLELSVGETALDKPGEVTCLLKSRYTDSFVLLTVEGKDLYEKRVIPMTGNVVPVTVRIEAAHAPNVFITATMQRGRALFMSRAEVSLASRGVAMNIEIKPDKPKYLPGEKVRIALRATDETGAPLEGDLSLGVVDEAIYLIRRDHTPKMRDVFYAKNSNWVLTNYSYPFTILAGAAKDSKVKVREKFADTAFWKADIRTDREGRASVEFSLPDNLTTWRMTARGHDRTGRVGESKDEFLTTQDLIARIGKPRFFIEGDRLGLIGIVNSNTDRGLPGVKTEFRADNKTIAPDEKLKVSLPPFGVASLYYPFAVPENKPSVDLFFMAEADADAKDALKLTVPVYSRGMNYKIFGAGDLGANRVLELTALKNSEDFEYRPDDIYITVNPSPIHQLLRGADYLANFPYGCIEQTLSGFIPALALQSLLKQRGLPSASAEKLRDKINSGIDRILRFQNSEGVWGWWAGDAGNEFITGYVLYCLQLAQSMGYDVDLKRIDASLEAVDRSLNETVAGNLDARALLFYASARWGKWNSNAFKTFAAAKSLTHYSRAHFIMALALGREMNLPKADKSAVAGALAQQIAALSAAKKVDRFGPYWESAQNQLWGWPGGNTEITAHVLSALAAARENTGLQKDIVRSLMRRSRGAAWKSTKETAAVILSICSHYEREKALSPQRGKVFFKMNGRDLTAIEFDSGNIDEPHKLTRIVKLPKGTKTESFKIEAAGPAAPDVTFSATLNGNLFFVDTPLTKLASPAGKSLPAAVLKTALAPFVKSEEALIRSINNGIHITRSYALLSRVRDINNNEYLVPQPIDGKRGLRIGDEILVTLKFQLQDDFEFLVLEDYLPAGFEVVRKNVYDSYQPYSHSERWDNRMVFFFTSLGKDRVHEVAYTLRAELPGSFLARPARMECMYEPGIQGWSAPARFIVEKK